MKYNIKAGDVFPTNDGGSVTVVERIDNKHIKIEHNDTFRHIANVYSQNLRNGEIKNPYFPSVGRVGYIGVGNNPATIKSKMTPAYKSWSKMIARCYVPSHQDKHPTYKGCSVDEKWHNYSVYAEWFYAQKNSQTAGFELDKDLLVLNNKVYSEITCSFVPSQINTLLNNCAAARGRYPQGVYAYKGSFNAQLSIDGKLARLGTYRTPEEAFDVYKKAKEKHVREIANRWREQLHPVVYRNLMEWTLQ